MLKETIQYAQQKGYIDIANASTLLLEQLEEFRKNWMKEYEKLAAKSRMDDRKIEAPICLTAQENWKR